MKRKFLSIPLALTALLVAGTLVSGAALAAPTANVKLDKTIRVHPKLQYGAQVEPNKTVNVLVQKLNAAVDLRALASRGKGKVGEDFSLFSTTSMEIIQKDVFELAREPGVLFVSPDGELSSKKKSDLSKVSNKGSNHDDGKDDDQDDDEQRLEDSVRRLAMLPVKKVKPALTLPTAANLLTTFNQDVKSPTVWAKDKGGLTGAGVTVAVLDTGVNPFHADVKSKVHPVFVNPQATGYLDELGHGTHVIGIINGRSAGDQYVGIAPDTRVISVKIADDKGAALESDMLRGIQWVYENKDRYDIKVVNLSLGAATPQSYKQSPIDAAVERLWQAGVTVVASAGNRGAGKGTTWYAPGNDPFVITVGCLDDNQTTKADDDSSCSFSSRGATQDGITKPELVAPGRRIVAPLASLTADLATQYPDRVTVDQEHIRLSGTSMSTPMVTGAAALLLQKYPALKPNQLKWLLTSSTHSYKGQPDKAGELDIAKAVSMAGGGLKEANGGLKLSPLLTLAGATNLLLGNSFWDNSFWDNSFWDNSFWDNSFWDNAYYDNSDNSFWDNAGGID
ncbi:MAG TPA: S8 family peptidase [Chloroflexota bacterium]